MKNLGLMLVQDSLSDRDLHRITLDPAVLACEPVIRGTRLSVEAPDGLVWFWIGSHGEYVEKIKSEGP